MLLDIFFLLASLKREVFVAHFGNLIFCDPPVATVNVYKEYKRNIRTPNPKPFFHCFTYTFNWQLVVQLLYVFEVGSSDSKFEHHPINFYLQASVST